MSTGAAADPWGMATMAATLPPSQPATTQPASNPFGVPAQAPQPTHQANVNAGGIPTLAANQPPFGAGPPPTPVGASSSAYGAAQAPFGSPPPSTINGPPQQEFTPATQASSIGFASPMAQPFPPQDDQQQASSQQQPVPQQQPELFQAVETAETQAPEPVEPTVAPPSNPALLSMNVLSGQAEPLVTESMANGANGTATGSMADQAYAKLVNMDAFDLVQSKDSEARKNPFDTAISTSNSIAGTNTNASLADMQKSKKPSEPKKSIMNAPAAAPGAMVLSNNQQGNFGGYGGLAGMNTMGTMGQQQQPTMGQPPALPQMQGYGGMQQQQAYGQPMQQQQAYGMQAQAPMQQPLYGAQAQQPGQYGQPPPLPQQQQQPYGQQPPPLQQQPFGF